MDIVRREGGKDPVICEIVPGFAKSDRQLLDLLISIVNKTGLYITQYEYNELRDTHGFAIKKQT